MNSIQLTGRLAQHPVYRRLPATDGKHVTELRLAVKSMGSGDRDAVGFIDLVSYTMTEKAAQTLGKGWLVALAGRVEHQTWETDGQRRGKHRVVASRVEFLAAPRNGDSEPDVSDFEPTADDDIPFQHAPPTTTSSACAATGPATTPSRPAGTRAAWPSRVVATCSPYSTTAATRPTATARAFASSPALPAPRHERRRRPPAVLLRRRTRGDNHRGCSYASPSPSPPSRPRPALSAARLAQHALQPSDGPGRCAIVGGTRTIRVRVAGPHGQLDP